MVFVKPISHLCIFPSTITPYLYCLILENEIVEIDFDTDTNRKIIKSRLEKTYEHSSSRNIEVLSVQTLVRVSKSPSGMEYVVIIM